MENWSPYWKRAYFLSLVWLALYGLFQVAAIGDGKFRGLTEAQWTVRLFLGLVFSVTAGLITARLFPETDTKDKS